MQEAQTEIDAAREALRVFVKELHDVEGASGIQIDTGGFMSFADMFFDNAFLDMYVQMRIDGETSRWRGDQRGRGAVREALLTNMSETTAVVITTEAASATTSRSASQA